MLLSGVGIILGVRWLGDVRRQNSAADAKQPYIAVIVVYSALVAARFYFNPVYLSILLSPSAGMLLLVIVYMLLDLLPRTLQRRGQISLRRSRAAGFVVFLLLGYALHGLTLGVIARFSESVEVETPRGVMRLAGQASTYGLRLDALRYIVSHTEPGEPVVVLEPGHGPSGFYFASGRTNPLRQDFFMRRPGLGGSPADAAEIVDRIEMHQPRLILVRSGIDAARGNGAGGPAHQGAEPISKTLEPMLTDVLMPVWRYVHEHYGIRAVIGGESSVGYVVYEPQ
jgi:hypothetical protein